MMICNGCGCRFDEPIIRRVKENLDGENGWQTFYEKRCPYCGSEEIEEIMEEDIDNDD